MYRLVQKKGTVLLSTSLVWPAVAVCSRAETVLQLGAISFAQPCRTLAVRYGYALASCVTEDRGRNQCAGSRRLCV